jgi:DNA repair exonuclease SbcCD nuclease subunit
VSRIILISDQHFDSRDGSPKIGEFQSRFYNEIFFPFLDANPDIQEVIDLGDTFDRRKNVNFTSLKRAKETYFDKLRDRGILLHSIIGNHTAAHKNTNEVNTMELLFGHYDNVRVYRDPETINIDGLEIAMLPWICSGNYSESMEFLKNTSAEIVMGHLELKGFEMYRGVVNEHGMETGVFKRFEMVLSGHFHHKSSRGNIHYLGSPYEMNWSDCNDKRGFHVFDTETRELTYVKNPLKLFHRLQYDEKQFTLDEIKNLDLSSFTGGNIKITVKDNSNKVLFDTLVKRLEEVRVSDIQVIEDSIKQQDAFEPVDESDDTLSILTKYISKMEGIKNKGAVESLMHSLYSEAMSLA